VIEAKGGPRKHHYVPQFYLRGFTDDKKQLLVTDGPPKRSFGPTLPTLRRSETSIPSRAKTPTPSKRLWPSLRARSRPQ
jgi:hypothetical protein